jgi:hypothetical protein
MGPKKKTLKNPIKRTNTLNSYGDRSIQFQVNSPDKSSKESSPDKGHLKFTTKSHQKDK